MERLIVAEIAGDVRPFVAEMREIEPSKLTPELISCFIISQSSFLGCVKGTKPEPSSVLGESNLGNPFPPMPLSNSPVKLIRFRRSTNMLHGDGFWAEVVEGLSVLALPLVMDCGLGYGCHLLLLLLLLLEVNLSLDLENLRWGELV
ncbi:hypothetical protein TorRG33x02_018220 [Trema orientale]|uniref:Uncharacterized protein n=1 Tax=Trema orientale TaxID=63057 RepID=A0A2P5FYG9_TREOI|nr:hypothetical protein TorRG33x02_018220 [Trema orientale]